MRMTRREFIRLSVMSGVAAGALGTGLLSFPTSAFAAKSPLLRKFVQPLRGVGPGGIPIVAPDAFQAPVTNVTHCTVDMLQFTDTLHPNLGPTTLWGYNPRVPLGGGVQPPKHLGGIVVVNRGTPLQFTFNNQLPFTHILPVDLTIPGAQRPQNRAAIHLHGGLVPWISDGGPFDWFGVSNNHGASFLNNQVLNPTALKNEGEYYYPNDQSARLLWYHDHAIGTTRLNAYAGLATAYIIRDTFEGNLRNLGLPDFIENGGNEIPIVIQDKVFVNEKNILTVDPTWTKGTTRGTMWYPHINSAAPAVDPSVVPEMFGDTMLTNGVVYPEAVVEPRRYRFRILNACNSRFLNLQLYVDDGSADGITLVPGPGGTFVPTNVAGPAFLVLGTEGGFLKNPYWQAANVPFQVTVDGSGNPVYSGSLITGNAERWDLIVDFKNFAGQKIILYNDAPAPFPNGDPFADFFFGNPKVYASSRAGFGPDTRQIMRFNVGTTITAPGDVPRQLGPNTDLTPGIDPFLAPYDPTTGRPVAPPGTPVRQLTLNEDVDSFGRLIQLIGTNVPVSPGKFGRAYTDPVTESVAAGTTEIWEIANISADTHPIHFHLVNVQVLWRRPFNVAAYNGTPTYTGPRRYPDAQEKGWKETLKMHPGEVIAVIMKFDLSAGLPFVVPPSPRTGGNEFVYHCHILEHEEHDMMRPLVVT
ncbi:MAG: multicopper oxidase domain-containing protein [Syntrophobacteraceae bacterium]